MKKFLVLLVPIFIFLFGTKSLAYTGPTGATYQYEYVFTEGSNTLRFYSNYLFFGCTQDNSSRPVLCAYIPYSPSVANDIDKYYVTTVTTGRNTYYMYTPDKKYPSVVTGQDTQWITWAELKYNSGTSTANWTVNWPSSLYQNINMPVFSTYQAGAEWAKEELTPRVDFENMAYLASIPTPNVWMVFDSLTASQDPRVPIIAKLAPTNWGSQSSLPLYLAVQYRIWSPTDVNIEIRNGFTYYRADAYEASETYDLYAFGDNFPVYPTTETEIYLQTADPNTSQSNDTIVEKFSDLLSQIAGVGRRFYGALSGSPQFQAGADAYNLYAKNAVTMGNRVEMWFTYYFVNDQQQAWCGLTTYWVSTNPEEFTTQQNAFDPLGTVSGWASSVIDTIRKTMQGGGGEGEPAPEYPSNNPTIGDPQFMPEQPASVPNNQNYPSIVSYNHDNIFTQFVGTYNSAKSFFGEFPQFFSDCLGWIPAEVWSVIAIGFGVAILVMILKIL